MPASSDDLKSFQTSYWFAAAAPAPEYRPLEANITADIVIVGAGYTGLAAALRMAEMGRDTVIVEANEPGFGASGRNAGCWVPNWAFATPPALRARFGDAVALRMARFMVDGGRLLPELVSRHGIDCDFQKTGVLYVSRKPKSLRTLRDAAVDWQAVEGNVRFVEGAELSRYTGSDRWSGGLLYEQAGLLNPLSFSRGLAAAAQRSGVRLFARSPAVAITPEGNRWRVSAPEGSVLASKVLIATNAFRPALLQLSRYFVSMRVGMVTSEPMPDWRRYLPHGAPYGDVDSKSGFYVGFDRHSRLTVSVLPTLSGGDPARLASAYWRQFRRVYPSAPAAVRWDYGWHGHICVPRDKIAKPMQLAPNLFTAFGYAGSGIVQATMMGREMAEWMTTGDRERVRMPDIAPARIPCAGLLSALTNRLVLPAASLLH